MSLSIKIELRDKSISELEELEMNLQPKEVNTAVARGGQNFLKAHFYKLDSQRANQMGGKRTHFYGQAARSVTQEIVTDGVLFSINQVGIRQRLEGGTILPKGSNPKTGKKIQYLTIPARAEAYGRRAGEFNNLSVLWGKNGPVALVENYATKVRKTKKGLKSGGETGGLVMYWLVPKVAQKKDPSVLPTNEELRAALLQEVRKALAVRAGRAN